MLGVLLLAATVFALTSPYTRWLAWYFSALILTTVITYGVLFFVPETSRLYHWAYFGTTATILLAIAQISRTALRKHSAKILTLIAAFLVSSGLSVIVWHEIGWPTTGEAINLLEGYWLVCCAVILGSAAPYLERRQREQAISLTLLWFVQALFRWGFVLHIQNETWINANRLLPFFFPFTCYVWLGMRNWEKLRAASKAPNHRAA